MRVVLHFHVLFPFTLEIVIFQVFQLTALVFCGPATRGERFIIRFYCVIIKEEEVRGVLLCSQDFVLSPHFTQTSLFSESGWPMLAESVTNADSVMSSPVCAPWSIVETACACQIVSDLRACWDRVVLSRCTAKDTKERCYRGGTYRSQTASRLGVRI